MTTRSFKSAQMSDEVFLRMGETMLSHAQRRQIRGDHRHIPVGGPHSGGRRNAPRFDVFMQR